jgi:hypothetical protein
MPKYIIRMVGKGLSCIGDNQRVTITQSSNGEQAVKATRPGRKPLSGEVRAIGRGAKVFVNGKRVQ